MSMLHYKHIRIGLNTYHHNKRFIIFWLLSSNTYIRSAQGCFQSVCKISDFINHFLTFLLSYCLADCLVKIVPEICLPHKYLSYAQKWLTFNDLLVLKSLQISSWRLKESKIWTPFIKFDKVTWRVEEKRAEKGHSLHSI